MQKALKVILIISIVINIILGFVLISRCPRHYTVNPNIYINKIDSLELELANIYSTRDSIRCAIDTIIVEINKNNNSYEEVRNTILSNSTNDDYLFFTEYLSKRK